MEIFSKYFPNFTMSTNLVQKGFCSISFIHIHTHNRGKLDLRAIKCIFVGHSSTQKVTNAIIYPFDNFMSLTMHPLLNMKATSIILISKERHHSWKIQI